MGPKRDGYGWYMICKINGLVFLQGASTNCTCPSWTTNCTYPPLDYEAMIDAIQKGSALN